MKKIIVYSKPNCMQCSFTKKYLDEKSIRYTAYDVYENEQALKTVEDLGFKSLPVVVIEGETPFFGFRPDLLEVLA